MVHYNYNDDPPLKEIVLEIMITDVTNYTLHALLPEPDNKRTAQTLGVLKDFLYSSLKEKFHLEGDEFVGGILYKEEDRYIMLE